MEPVCGFEAVYGRCVVCGVALWAIPSVFFSCAYWVLPFAALFACSHASSLFFSRLCPLRRRNLLLRHFPFLNFTAAFGSISITRSTASHACNALQPPRQIQPD